jgi:predicted dehydrogenase
MMANSGKSAQTLGYALIGCGGAGRAHAGWAAETGGVAVRGFCDIHEGAAQQLQAQHGADYATTDPERVFSDPAVDIVSIATSHSSHADLAVAALQAGKHLFLEKPMAMTTADCLRIHAAMQAAGTKLMLNFSIRFSGAACAIRQRLAPPKVSHSQCMMSRADLNRWRWHPVEGGGPLWDVGVHMVDYLCWIHDSAPVEVYATGGQVTHPGELGSADMVDTAAATIRFANDAVATFLMSDAGSNSVISKWFFEFFDGQSSAVLYEHFRKVTFSTDDPEEGQQSETLTPPPIERLSFLVEAIRNDTEPYVPPQAGILSTLLVESITKSIQSGQPQKVDLSALPAPLPQ